MVVPSPLKRRELRRIEISEIDAAHLGAERSPGRNHVNRLTTSVARNFTLDAQNHRNLQRHGPIGKYYHRMLGEGSLRHNHAQRCEPGFVAGKAPRSSQQDVATSLPGRGVTVA